MEPLIIAVHILISLAIIALVLLQQGKGAEMGASFGAGGSQTLFGASGGGNLLSRITAILVTLFFITSFSLSMLATQRSQTKSDAGVPSAELIEQHNKQQAGDAPVVETPAATDAPAVEAPAVETPAVEAPAAPAADAEEKKAP